MKDLEIRNCPEFSGQPSVTNVLRGGLGGCGQRKGDVVLAVGTPWEGSNL